MPALAACTRPGLSNQVARRLDRRLAGLAAKLGLVSSRYADDLTFTARTEGLDRQNRENLPDFAAWLRGKTPFVRMAQPEIGDRLLSEVDALEKRDRNG
jgi:hypothetical protein